MSTKLRGLTANLQNLDVDIEETSTYSDYFQLYNLKDEYPIGFHTALIVGSERLRKGTYIKIEIRDEGGRPIPINLPSSASEYEQNYLPSRRFGFEVVEDTLNGLATMTCIGTTVEGETVRWKRQFLINKNSPSIPLIDRGEWADGEYYEANNVVQYQGSSYKAILRHEAILGDNEPPNATYWRVFAQKGDDGADGAGLNFYIEATNGFTFYNGGGTTNLIARLLEGGVFINADTYTWYKDGVEINGETTDTLTVNATDLVANASVYRVEADYGTATLNATARLINLVDGAEAEILRLSADSFIFEEFSNGEVEPTVINIEALRINHNKDVEWFFVDGGVETQITGATTGVTFIDPLNIEITTDIFDVGERSKRIMVRTTDETLFDITTFFLIKEGSDAITINIPNDNHTFPANSDGEVLPSSYADSVTEAVVKWGNADIVYNENATVIGDLANLEFFISAINVSPTGAFGASNVGVDLVKNGDNLQIGITEMNDAIDQGIVSITFQIKIFNDDVRTFVRTLSYNKSKEPEPVRFIRILSGNQIFIEDSEGQITPNELTFELDRLNVVGTATWSVDGTPIGTTSEIDDPEVISVDPTDLTGNRGTLEVEVTDGGNVFIDRLTVAILKEGSDGEDGISGFTVILQNGFHSIPTDSDGVVQGGLPVSDKITVYRGEVDVTDNFDWSAGLDTNATDYTLVDDEVTFNSITNDVERFVFEGTPKVGFDDYPNPVVQTVLVVKNKQGLRGNLGRSFVFRGIWDNTVTYDSTDVSTDIVLYQDNYYYVEDDASTTGDDPTLGSPWVQFQGEYEALATDILLVKNATIRQILTMGSKDAEDNVYGETGIIRSLGAINLTLYDDQDWEDDDLITTPAWVEYDQATIEANPNDYQRFFELSPQGLKTYRGEIGSWTIKRTILESVTATGGIRLNSDIQAIDLLNDEADWIFRIKADETTFPNDTFLRAGDTITFPAPTNGTDIDEFDGVVFSNIFNIDTAPFEAIRSTELRFRITAINNSFGEVSIQASPNTTGDVWETVKAYPISGTWDQDYSFDRTYEDYKRIRFRVDVGQGSVSVIANSGADGHPLSSSAITIRQYNQRTIVNAEGIFSKINPLKIVALTGSSSAISVSQLVEWDGVINKPFVTIGTNLSVSSGALRVNATKSTQWDNAYTHSQITTGNPHQLDTDDVSEGVGNLYHTSARVQSVVAGGDTFQTLAVEDAVTFNGITSNANITINNASYGANNALTGTLGNARYGQLASANTWTGTNIFQTAYLQIRPNQTTILNMRRTDITANQREWSYRIDADGHLDIRSVADNNTSQSISTSWRRNGNFSFFENLEAGNDIVIDSNRKFIPVDIESDNWNDGGFVSSGYRVTNIGDATFESVLIRSALRARELILDQLSVVGGTQLLSSARGRIESIDSLNSQITIESPTGLNATQFEENDLFWIQVFDVDGTNGNIIVSATGTVTAKTGRTLTLSFTTGVIGDLSVGDVIVQRGSTSDASRRALLYQTVNDGTDDVPYTRYLRNVSSLAGFTNQTNIAVQVGVLDNLTNASGVGLYGSNVFLTESVLVGDLTATDHYLQFADGKLSWKSPNTELTEDGDLIASNATLSGTVTANAGSIGGWTVGNNVLSSSTTAGAISLNSLVSDTPADDTVKFSMSSYFGVDLKETLTIQPDGTPASIHEYQSISKSNISASSSGSGTTTPLDSINNEFTNIIYVYDIDFTSVDWNNVNTVVVRLDATKTGQGFKTLKQTEYTRETFENVNNLTSEYLSTNSRDYIQCQLIVFYRADVPTDPVGSVTLSNIIFEETNTTIAVNSQGIFRRVGTNIVEPVGDAGVGFTTVSSVFGRTGDVTAQVEDYESFYAKLTGATFTGNVTAPNVIYGDNSRKSRNIDGVTLINDLLESGVGFRPASGDAGQPTASHYHILHSQHPSSDTFAFQFASRYSGDNELWFRNKNTTWNTWREIWHSGHFDPSDFAELTGATFTGNVNFSSFFDTKTQLGLTGNQGLSISDARIGNTSATEATWASLSLGERLFVRGNTVGAPVTNLGFVDRVGNRDTGGGYAIVWYPYGANVDQFYVGYSSNNTSFPTWQKVALHNTSPTFSGAIYTGTVDISQAGTGEFLKMIRTDGGDDYSLRIIDGGLTVYNDTDSRKEMTFDGTGKVGIGTTDITEMLTVQGTIRSNATIRSVTDGSLEYNMEAYSGGGASSTVALRFHKGGVLYRRIGILPNSNRVSVFQGNTNDLMDFEAHNVFFNQGTFAGTSNTFYRTYTKQVADRSASSVNSVGEIRIPWASTNSGNIVLDVEVQIETNSVGTRHYIRKRFFLASYSLSQAGELYDQESYIPESTRGNGYVHISDAIDDIVNDEIIIELFTSTDRSISVKLTAWGNNAVASQILDATYTGNVQTGVTVRPKQDISFQNNVNSPEVNFPAGVNSTKYEIGGTTVIDVNRHATFVNGTFTGIVNINNQLRVDNGSGLPSATYATTLTNATAYFKRSNSGTRIFFGVESFDRGWIQPQHNDGSLYNLLLNPVGGNVGIGLTTVPTEKLEVNGFVRSSSGYKVGATTVIDSSRNASFAGGTFTGILSLTSGNGYVLSGADDRRIILGGGSSATSSTGAYIILEGHDHQGVDAGGDIIFRPSTGGTSDFAVGNVRIANRLHINSASATGWGVLEVHGTGISNSIAFTSVTSGSARIFVDSTDTTIWRFTRNGSSANGFYLNSAGELRVLGSEATNTTLHVRRGLSGSYNDTADGGGTSNWGANIWSIGNNWSGDGHGSNFTLDTAQYGLVWLRSVHTSAISSNEGLYLYRASNTPFVYFGHAGSRFYNDVRVDGDHSAVDHIDSSDRRLKTNLVIHDPLDIARHATLYKYNKRGLDRPQYGIIAQDIMEYDPDLGIPLEDKEFGEIYNLSAYSVASIALAGVKEIDSEVEKLKSRVLELEDQVRALGGNI